MKPKRHPQAIPFPRYRARLAALLLLTLALSLACLTTTYTIQITHNYEPGQEPMVWVEVMQELDPAYVQEAKAANADITARCRAANVDCANALLPETLAQFQANPQFGQLSMGAEDAEEEGFTRVETEDMLQLRRGWTLAEYEAYRIAQTDQDEAEITVSVDPITRATRYVIEFPMGDQEAAGDSVEFWSSWDAAMEEPEPPKPDVLPAPTTAEGNLDAEPSAMDAVLGDMFRATEDGPGMELQAWYWQHIIRKRGFPTLFTLVLDMPGRIESHTLNGQPAGVLDADRGAVVLAFDEAFLRGPGASPPWVFRVESVVEAKDKAPTPTRPAKEAQLRPTPAAPALLLGEPTSRFRARLVDSKSLGALVGTYQADYELQELSAEGTPGRAVRLRYVGMGLALGGGYGRVSADEQRWVEFAPRQGPMRLSDFHGARGWRLGGGAFSTSWGVALICTPDSLLSPAAGFHGVSAQKGPYAVLALTWGVWEVVGSGE